MGQKVNPVGLRIGVNRTWDSRWYGDRDYAKLLAEDLKLRSFIEKRLSQAGISREDAYRLVQRNAMRVWREGGDFLAALAADPEVTAALPPDRLAGLFDMAHHTRHVDTIFRRVFGDG